MTVKGDFVGYSRATGQGSVTRASQSGATKVERGNYLSKGAFAFDKPISKIEVAILRVLQRTTLPAMSGDGSAARSKRGSELMALKLFSLLNYFQIAYWNSQSLLQGSVYSRDFKPYKPIKSRRVTCKGMRLAKMCRRTDKRSFLHRQACKIKSINSLLWQKMVMVTCSVDGERC